MLLSSVRSRFYTNALHSGRPKRSVVGVALGRIVLYEGTDRTRGGCEDVGTRKQYSSKRRQQQLQSLKQRLCLFGEAKKSNNGVGAMLRVSSRILSVNVERDAGKFFCLLQSLLSASLMGRCAWGVAKLAQGCCRIRKSARTGTKYA